LTRKPQRFIVDVVFPLGERLARLKGYRRMLSRLKELDAMLLLFIRFITVALISDEFRLC